MRAYVGRVSSALEDRGYPPIMCSMHKFKQTGDRSVKAVIAGEQYSKPKLCREDGIVSLICPRDLPKRGASSPIPLTAGTSPTPTLPTHTLLFQFVFVSSSGAGVKWASTATSNGEPSAN